MRFNGIASVVGALAVLLAAQGASAQGMEQEAPKNCSLVRVALPPELAGWSDRAPAPAAKDGKGLAKSVLTIGKAVDARLIRTADVRYPLRPEKPGGSVSYGGLFAFTVKDAGTYRVALGAGAWIDVVKDGKPVASSGHGHGPQCSGVRKMVDFPLTPGRYVLQLAANGSESLPVAVVRLP
ncbi:MAG TPA: homogentisate 1,2-dioxygenase [Sphingobium sp.]